jgi:hypothetical protein
VKAVMVVMVVVYWDLVMVIATRHAGLPKYLPD